MPDPASNDFFQTAVNNAVLFKAVVCLVGLACIVMGYRLLAGRAGDRSSGEPPHHRHSAAGLILGVFGMCIIGVALFRNAPAKLQRETQAQGEGSSSGAGSYSSEMRRNPAPTSMRPANHDFSNVRESVGSPSGSSVTSQTSFGSSGEESVRPPREVRTKGAYVPFNRRPVNEANR